MTTYGRLRMAWPSTSRGEAFALAWPGSLSAPPDQYAAGSMARASSTRNSAPICHGSRARRLWVASGMTNVPRQPIAETMPTVVLRRAGDAARTQAVITSDVVTQDSATPISPPETKSADALAATPRSRSCWQKKVGPAAKRDAVAHLRGVLEMSERRACSLVAADRKMIRYRSRRPPETELRARLRDLANQRRRFGYRRLFILLRDKGEPSGVNRIYRLYREEGLAVRKRKS